MKRASKYGEQKGSCRPWKNRSHDPKFSPAYSDPATGNGYSEEQFLWLKAIAAFHSRCRRYPTLIEAFRLAIAMGYRQAT